MEREEIVYWAFFVVPVVAGLLLAGGFLSFTTPRQRRRDDLAGRSRR
jgi:hypothetical protein